MHFSEADLSRLDGERALLQTKYVHLIESFTNRVYQHSRAREFAQQGFARRLKTLTRCIQQVFVLVPPETQLEPDFERRVDAEIYIQSFVSNIFGSLDNLAWVLIYEKQITQDDGTPVQKSRVGLRPENTFLRGKLSAELQQYLGTLNDWFRYLENYRHALAHRIPLYIPPYVVSPNYPNGMFRPFIMHSYEEPNVRPFVFHPQMLADFNTVDEIARRVLDELDI